MVDSFVVVAMCSCDIYNPETHVLIELLHAHWYAQSTIVNSGVHVKERRIRHLHLSHPYIVLEALPALPIVILVTTLTVSTILVPFVQGLHLIWEVSVVLLHLRVLRLFSPALDALLRHLAACVPLLHTTGAFQAPLVANVTPNPRPLALMLS
jgi:hypothetical protein